MWLSFSRSSQCEQEFPTQVVKKISLFQQVMYARLYDRVYYNLFSNMSKQMLRVLTTKVSRNLIETAAKI